MSALSLSQKALICGAIISTTILGMAAIDLFLPAVPRLPELVGGGIVEAQLTLAGFMLGLAVTVPIYGVLGDVLNKQHVLRGAVTIFFIGSVACALSSDIYMLIGARVVQGAGAGSGIVVGPSIIRSLFSDTAAIRVIGLMGSIEAMVPAFAPIVGALLIAQWGWTSPAWVAASISAFSLVVLSLVRLGTAARPQGDDAVRWSGEFRGYIELLGNRRFMAYALSHSFMFGGLLTYVFSAPQLITKAFGEPIAYFSYMQLFGVSMFVLAANAAGFVVKRVGRPPTLWLGQALQSVSALAMLAAAWAGVHTWWQMMLCMAPYLLGLGLRGGTGVVSALDAAPGYGARAMALLLFTGMAFSSIGCALVAPTLEAGLMGTAVAIVLFTLASALTLRLANAPRGAVAPISS
jgi:MFS transporter, DHA1 family, multidrug resistance protein